MVNENLLKGKYISKGYRQEDLAALIGVSKTAFRQKLKGKREFKGLEIQKLLTLLEIQDSEIRSIFFSS